MFDKIDTALIFCAGYGKRLRPLTDILPKPLLPVNGCPMLFKIIDKLRGVGVKRFFVNIHHLPQKFADIFGLGSDIFTETDVAVANYNGCEIILVYEPEILDTGGGIKNILEKFKIDYPIIVHNGDILFDAPAENFISSAEFAIRDDAFASVCSRSSGNLANVGISDDKIVDMRFQLGAEYEKLVQYCGFFVLSEKSYPFFKAEQQKAFSVVDTFLKMISSGKKLAVFMEDFGSWDDIGTRKEYFSVNSAQLPDEFSALAALCEAGFEPIGLNRITKGASARRFFRFTNKGEKYVACFYCPEPKENLLYEKDAKFLEACFVPVPKIIYSDESIRLSVMEDGGSRDMSEVPATKKEVFYKKALRAAKRLHTYATAEYKKSPFDIASAFDDALYSWEQNYFWDECVIGEFQMNIERPEKEFSHLRSTLLSYPTSLVFRDFQSQNVMVSENDEIRVIDFQGMRLGNPFYDVASLLFDPYVEPLSEEFLESVLREYVFTEPYNSNIYNYEFAKEMLNLAGAQRLMQALGAYGFLSRKKGRLEYKKFFKPAAYNLEKCAKSVGLTEISNIAKRIFEESEKYKMLS